MMVLLWILYLSKNFCEVKANISTLLPSEMVKIGAVSPIQSSRVEK